MRVFFVGFGLLLAGCATAGGAGFGAATGGSGDPCMTMSCPAGLHCEPESDLRARCVRDDRQYPGR